LEGAVEAAESRRSGVRFFPIGDGDAARVVLFPLAAPDSSEVRVLTKGEGDEGRLEGLLLAAAEPDIEAVRVFAIGAGDDTLLGGLLVVVLAAAEAVVSVVRPLVIGDGEAALLPALLAFVTPDASGVRPLDIGDGEATLVLVVELGFVVVVLVAVAPTGSEIPAVARRRRSSKLDLRTTGAGGDDADVGVLTASEDPRRCGANDFRRVERAFSAN